MKIISGTDSVSFQRNYGLSVKWLALIVISTVGYKLVMGIGKFDFLESVLSKNPFKEAVRKTVLRKHVVSGSVL